MNRGTIHIRSSYVSVVIGARSLRGVYFPPERPDEITRYLNVGKVSMGNVVSVQPYSLGELTTIHMFLYVLV